MVVDEENADENSQRKTRGPTYMTEIWGKPSSCHRYKVRFDKDGEPVGKNKSKFTEFLGIIARNGKYAPLDVTDWREMTNDKKQDMLVLVKVMHILLDANIQLYPLYDKNMDLTI